MHAGPDAVYCHGRCPELELTQELAGIRASDTPYGAQDPCPAVGPTLRNRVGLISDGGFQILVACSKS